MGLFDKMKNNIVKNAMENAGIYMAPGSSVTIREMTEEEIAEMHAQAKAHEDRWAAYDDAHDPNNFAEAVGTVVSVTPTGNEQMGYPEFVVSMEITELCENPRPPFRYDLTRIYDPGHIPHVGDRRNLTTDSSMPGQYIDNGLREVD